MHGDVLRKQRVKKNGDLYSSFKDNRKEVTKLSSFPYNICACFMQTHNLTVVYEPDCLQYGGTMLLLVTFWPITTAVSGKMFRMLTILTFIFFYYRSTLVLRAFETIRKFVLEK